MEEATVVEDVEIHIVGHSNVESNDDMALKHRKIMDCAKETFDSGNVLYL